MDASPTFILSCCVGKAAFATPQLAKKVQRRRAKRKLRYTASQEVYHCPACGQFHIGTKSKPRQTTTSGRRTRFRVDIEGDDSMR